MKNAASAVWKSVQRDRLHTWERARHWARLRGFKLEVIAHERGGFMAEITQKLPPVHAVETLATRTLSSANATLEHAKRWCEARAKELDDERREISKSARYAIAAVPIAADSLVTNGAPVRLDAALVIVVLALVLWYLGVTLVMRFGVGRDRNDGSSNWSIWR